MSQRVTMYGAAFCTICWTGSMVINLTMRHWWLVAANACCVAIYTLQFLAKFLPDRRAAKRAELEETMRERERQWSVDARKAGRYR